MTLDLRSLLLGAVLGAALAMPAAVAATLAWHAGRQLDREAQSLTSALGCGPSAELEFSTAHGVGLVKCKSAAQARGSGD